MKTRTLTALPVFNEARHIDGVLDEVLRFCDDVLVVDDGSSDATPQILSLRTDVHVVTHEQNEGYGAALRTAFGFARDQGYDVLVTIDCDGQHQPSMIPELAQRIFQGDGTRIDLVSGSRYLEQFDTDSTPPEDRRRINQQLTAELNARLGLQLTDSFCGFKAYLVESLADLDITETGYAMPLQFWVQVVRSGWRIVEYPVPLIYLEEERSFGGSLDNAARRLAYYREVLEKECAQPGSRCVGSTLQDETLPPTNSL